VLRKDGYVVEKPLLVLDIDPEPDAADRFIAVGGNYV